ncbi:MAG: M15 family metallopeptidase [Thermodesulfobacteriota bacterium]
MEKSPVDSTISLRLPDEAQVVPQETVSIGGQDYDVKSPWLGSRIEGEFDPARMDLVRLPVELVFEGRNIYVARETRDAFIVMAAAAAKDGIGLMVDSGYRSAAYQQRIYKRKMAQGDDFYAVARWVAPPGYSEHMTGTTLDLVPSNWSFNGTLADKWLQENGGVFSFTQSYPQNSPGGFAWEPWHWKYTGGS